MTMRRVLAIAAAFAATITVTACGGTKTVTRTIIRVPPAPPSFVVAGGHCLKAPADTAAICQLRDQTPPLALSSPLGVPLRRGLDSWGPPPLSVLDGSYQFAQAYLSTDPSKNWSRASVTAYRAAGKGVVMDWETYATRAAAGRAAGVSDAIEASRQAADDGAPGAPINFAIDFQATCPQIVPYFVGVYSVLGNRANWRLSRDDAYGGYDQILCLWNHHLIGHQSQQTYAWSGGRWLPASIAPLEQWLNGNTYDQDRALTASYGQAFQSAPRPPDPLRFLDHTLRHFLLPASSPVWGAPGVVTAREFNTVARYRARGCRRPLRRPVCVTSHQHAGLLRGRLLKVLYRHHGRNVNHIFKRLALLFPAAQ